MRSLAFAAVLAMTGMAFAQDDSDGDAALRALLEENVHELSVGPSGLSGPGARLLLDRARQAQFVALGEQHGTADIGEFAHAWFLAIQPEGFNYMAVEVGPHSTRAAEQLLAGPEGAFEADALARAGGLAYPFLFFQNDADLARDVVRLHEGQGPALWGLDQEFIAAGSILLDELRLLAVNEAQRTVVAAIEAALAEQPFLIGAAPQSQWAGWADAWGEGEGSEMLADILHSNAIYAPFSGRGGNVWLANQTREDNIKRIFAEQFAAAEARDGIPPRVFLKFGGNHLARWNPASRISSLGNFLTEWGHPRGFTLFNVMADCAGGEMLNVQAGGGIPCTSYFGSTGGVLAGLIGSQPVVVDLQAIRPAVMAMRDADEDFVALVRNFDAYIAFPDTRPARMISTP